MSQTPSPIDFDALLQQTQARIRAYIAGMGIASHEIDDVAQDVYVELYRNQEKIPPGVAPERWLKGIARNLCLNHIRRCSRRGRLHREALAELLAKTETRLGKAMVDTPVSVALDGCCNKLPERSRRMLQLRYEHDLPSDAIAKAMNSTASAVRIALFRIRAKLKECVAENLAGQT